MIRHVIEGELIGLEAVFTVVNLYDARQRPTDNPEIAVSGVAEIAPGSFVPFDASIVDIYTVH